MLRRYAVAAVICTIAMIAHPAAAAAQRVQKTIPPQVEGSEAFCAPDSELLNFDDEESQSPTVPPRRTQPTRRFLNRLLEDQKTIWTSPFQLKRGDARWLAPLAAAAIATYSFDQKTVARVDASEELSKNSRTFSVLGSGYATFGVAGAFYACGRLAKNERAQETGMLGIEALIQTSIVVTGLKLAFERERPSKPQSDGSFWEGGTSFPSGHAAVAFTIASVIAQEYSDKPVVRVAAYGLATAVALSRIAGRNHFPSDVLAGSAIGYFIGRSIVTVHGSHAGNKKIPTVSPYVSRASRSYGLRATFGF